MYGEHNWHERVLVVRSHAYAQTQRQHLEDRLTKAQEALFALTPPVGRGKRQITEETALQSAAEAVLAKYPVTGLLIYAYQRESEQEVKFVGRGRGGANRQQQVIERVRYQIMTVTHNEERLPTSSRRWAGERMSRMRHSSACPCQMRCGNIGTSTTSNAALGA